MVVGVGVGVGAEDEEQPEITRAIVKARIGKALFNFTSHLNFKRNPFLLSNRRACKIWDSSDFLAIFTITCYLTLATSVCE